MVCSRKAMNPAALPTSINQRRNAAWRPCKRGPLAQHTAWSPKVSKKTLHPLPDLSLFGHTEVG
eukprot:15438401-Alexandrium_andersonii.AAC.2